LSCDRKDTGAATSVQISGVGGYSGVIYAFLAKRADSCASTTNSLSVNLIWVINFAMANSQAVLCHARCNPGKFIRDIFFFQIC
jgi:hypothetical protein